MVPLACRAGWRVRRRRAAPGMADPARGDDLVAKLRAFITRRYLARRTRPVADDEPLFSSGVIDSLGLVDLTNFIETELGVMLTPDEFGEGRADTVAEIAVRVATER